MLGFLGDIHTNHFVLEQADAEFARLGCVAGIQVGDLGWYPFSVPYFNQIKLQLPWYWIPGNHEYFPYLNDYTTVTEVAPNLFYVPKGIRLELDGRQILFVGGGASVDKAWRTPGKDWFPEENISDEELKRIDVRQPVDILVTHAAPQSLVDRHLDRNNLRMFGLPTSWVDPNAIKLEEVWRLLNYPTIIFGHYHMSFGGQNYRCLDINERCFL